MSNTFTWKGEITFTGTAQEFARLGTALDQLAAAVEVKVADGLLWPPRPRPWPGFPPPPWWKKFPQDRLNKLIEGSPRYQVKFIKDFPGGIRDPHLHLENEVVFLNREQFKVLVGEVAAALAVERADLMADYIDVMAPVNALASIPIQLP